MRGDRTQQAYYARCDGMDWPEIATRYGFADTTTAQQIVDKWRRYHGLPGFRAMRLHVRTTPSRGSETARERQGVAYGT